MRNSSLAWFIAAAVCTAMIAGAGCPNNGAPLDDTNTGDNAGLTFVKTAIPVGHDGGLVAGDDLIVFGTGSADLHVGVSYVVPSTHPTVGTALPPYWDSSAFAVGGKTIFLVGSKMSPMAYRVCVQDTVTGQSKVFDPWEVRLAGIPAKQTDPGNIQASGNYCVTICDPSQVTDGKVIKVIDVTSGTAALITFTYDISFLKTDPGSLDPHYQNTYVVKQVAVDAASKTVVAAVRHHEKWIDNRLIDNTFLLLYNIDAPDAMPASIGLPNGISDSTQMRISGGYVVGRDSQGHPFLLDLGRGWTVTTLADVEADGGAAQAEWCVAVGGTKFSYFSSATASEASGNDHRAAVGTIVSFPGTPTVTKAALGRYIDGATAGNGLVGFAQTVAIHTGSGSIFLGGAGSIGPGEYLQYSAGTAGFSVPTDATGGDAYGIPATDVSVSNNTLAFKTGTSTAADTETTLGYAVLP